MNQIRRCLALIGFALALTGWSAESAAWHKSAWHAEPEPWAICHLNVSSEEAASAESAAAAPAAYAVDKTKVENDDHLKCVIKNYFKIQHFKHPKGGRMEITVFYDISVKSISGTMFIVDIDYEQSDGSLGKTGKATVKIEKTVDSYKIINFDRIRGLDF